MCTESEILAVEVTLPGGLTFSLVNAYFPLGVMDTRSLDLVLLNCGKKIVLAGDFNSHHISWGFRTDQCGKRLWDWAASNNFSCQNTGSLTFVRGQFRSVLDLTFSGPGLSVLSWETIEAGTNSDHIPVVFEIHCSLHRAQFNIRSFIDHNRFKTNLRATFTSLAGNPCSARNVCAILDSSRKRSEFEIKGSKDPTSKNWWTDDCSREYKRRKAAWKQLMHNQSPRNWINYKFIAGTFKRTVARAKDEYKVRRFEFLSKSNNKTALFRYLRSIKVIPRPLTIESMVLTSREIEDSLGVIARGLEVRFSTCIPSTLVRQITPENVEDISLTDLSSVVSCLPAAAPGHDGITTKMLKIFFDVAPHVLLDTVNYSIKHAWIPSVWKVAKVIPVLKDKNKGHTLDNIRPISLTSNFVKLIERLLHTRITKFVTDKKLLSPCQIGFRQGMSIWCAHVDLESRIQLARRQKQYAALVTLDISKAYDSVEYPILLERMKEIGLPDYFISWTTEFLLDREFYCVQGGISTRVFRQTRGVPQGAVLSPLLFNILLSSIPRHQRVNTYVYADDIAFFASADDIQSLYAILQGYLSTLEYWLDNICLTINVQKCAVLAFSPHDHINISLSFHQADIPQVQSVKYLGVIYDGKLNWRMHIEHTATKASRAMGMLRRISNNRWGMRTDTLIMIYRMYIRPILEFGCALFSGAPAWKLRPLILVERQALRWCLGLPKFVANAVLYKESRIPSLSTRFKLITVQTFLRLYESPIRRDQYIFISQPAPFFNASWPRFHTPQVIFTQHLLDPLQIKLNDIVVMSDRLSELAITYDDIFPNNAKLLPWNVLNGIFQDHLNQIGTTVVIATDASQCEEKAGVGIFSSQLDWSFSVRLPDYTQIFLAEFLAVILALRKLPFSITSVAIVTDSLSLCSALITPTESHILRLLRLLVPHHLRNLRLIWVPGHRGIVLNEVADTLAKASLAGPVLALLPVTAFVAAARFRTYALSVLTPSLASISDFQHLQFPWSRKWCGTRATEVVMTRLRCRIPNLNFYMHRAGLAVSPSCSICGEAETIEHFLLNCRRFSSLRKRNIEIMLRQLGLPVTSTILLSFGASALGHCDRNIYNAIEKFVCESKRFSSCITANNPTLSF
uniref:Putative tick transposon n=1 Tax=Rhipicephalus pulchellus TaxID=72859 RepID=L7LXP3_RHIPC